MSSRFLELPSGPGRQRRGLALGVVAVVSALVTSACLTPDFKFGDRPPASTDDGGGGAPPVFPVHCENLALDAAEGETDVDCGGPCATCKNGDDCLLNADCTSNICTGGICVAAPSCTDRKKNQDETDIDCGGKKCSARCDDERSCLKASDCTSGVCTDSTCAAPACDDGVKNGEETAVDCGGDCGGCLGADCEDVSDCAALAGATVLCRDNVCALDIALKATVAAELDWTLNSSLVAAIDVDKTLARSGHRALVVLVSGLSKDAYPVSVTYGGLPLAVQDEVYLGASPDDDTADVAMRVYLADECAIAAAPSNDLRFTMQSASYSGAVMDARLFENVEQDFTDAAVSIGLPSAETIQVDRDLAKDGWFFGGAANQGAVWNVETPPSPSTGNPVNHSPNDFETIVSHFGPLTPGVHTFAWKSSFQAKVAAGMALAPAHSVAPSCP